VESTFSFRDNDYMRIRPHIKYTWKSATKYGLAPDERCDTCGGKFKQEPIIDQSLTGVSKIFCNEKCSQ